MSAAQKAIRKRIDEAYPTAEAIAVLISDLEALLAEPRLPKEPSDAAINAMMQHGWDAKDIYRALYAQLTAPKPKTFRVTINKPPFQCPMIWTAMSMYEATAHADKALKDGHAVTIEPEGT